MTLKTKKNIAKQPVNKENGFTLSENYLIDQLEIKKKKKVKTPTPEADSKIGKMFKKKKSVVEDEDEKMPEPPRKLAMKKAKKVKEPSDDEDDMADSDNEFEAEEAPKKKNSKKVQIAPVNQDEVPGFAVSKQPKKRKHEGENFDAKKAKKGDGKEEKELTGKELKIDRKKKEGGSRYDLSIRAKKIWEQLRREDTLKDKQLSLAAELFGLIKGHLKELVFAHDTARVIECCFEKGSQQVKDAIFNELKSHTINLAKSQYGHFYLMKVLKHGNREQRTYIIQALSGKVAFLMKHKIASKVVETAYNDWANAEQRAQLAQEFYGPEFKLFKDKSITTLAGAIAKHPEKKEAFLKYMNQAIEPIIGKGVFNHSLLHRLTNEYLTYCREKERTEMIQSLRQAVVQVLHTRDGARIGMTCIWHGTSKDRKDIIKSFKGHVAKICQEEHGHMVLMALFDAVDDTKLVAKAIISEMATNWKTIAVHEHGRKVVMYLLAGRDPKYTHPQVMDILKLGDGNANSKKDMELRRKELLQHASPAWLDAVVQEPEVWLKDSKNTLVLVPILTYCVGEELAPAFNAIANIVGKPLDVDVQNALSSEGDKVKYWVEQPAVHMVIKKLIQFDKIRAQPPYFSQALIDEVDEDELKGWLSCNRGAFIVVNMIETEIDSVKKTVIGKLKNLRKYLLKQNNKGADILDKKISNFD